MNRGRGCALLLRDHGNASANDHLRLVRKSESASVKTRVLSL